MRRRMAGGLVPLAAALVLAGCPDRDAAQDTAEDTGDRFEARIQGLGQDPIQGVVRIEVRDGEFAVDLAVSGLEPEAAVTQHIYSWWDCTTIGRIVVNLDTLLTVPGEGPPRGEAYPRADAEGRVEFTATRPVAEMEEVLNRYRGMFFAELDLGNRTIFVRDEGHRPIACGELREPF